MGGGVGDWGCVSGISVLMGGIAPLTHGQSRARYKKASGQIEGGTRVPGPLSSMEVWGGPGVPKKNPVTTRKETSD